MTEAGDLARQHLEAGRYAEALAPLREDHAKAPRKGTGHRLGYCLLALGDLTGAEAVLRQEVDAYPDLIDARNALGVAIINQGRRDDALAVFLEAARLAPQSAEANNNVANVLSDFGRHDEAIPYLERAIAAQPGMAESHHNLGMLYQSRGRHEEAIASLEKAIDLAPDATYSLSQLVWSEISVCRWDRLAGHVEKLRAQVRRGIAGAPFVFVAVSKSPEEQRRCGELFLRDRLPALPQPMAQGGYKHDRIRVAYLSGDFRQHATAQLAAGLFERHDRSKFETIAVSYGNDDGSPMRRRLEAAFDRFIDVQRQGDAEVAAMLRNWEVDIAVDLKGHTTEARFGILAHRPAPVQVTWLGYPGSSGAPFIDYVLADKVVLPQSEQRHFSEKVVYLPDCYQVNDSTRRIADATPTRAASGLPRNEFVFCSFNNNYKITPEMFGLWMRLLQFTPGSVLWLLEDNAVASANLRREAQARGIAPERLVFAPRLPAEEHLARHRIADVFLDTLPYNAHTTASDSLWAGTPVITCAGETFAGRVAASLLRAVGLPELITNNLKEYEALALKLAQAPALCGELRAKLARNRASAPLFDTDRFRRNMEAAYTTMWQRAERGEAPAAFSVDG